MNIGEKVVKSINTIINQKFHHFDRTVQAIVRDASDPEGIGEIKVAYKDTVLSAYTETKNVKNYKQGDHVYLSIPNNDMNERKTIVGLVEKIGPLTAINDDDGYAITRRYQTDNSSLDLRIADRWNNDTNNILNCCGGWCYRRNTEEDTWEVYAISSNSNEDDTNITETIIENPSAVLSKFFDCFKNFIVQSDYTRLSANFSVKLYAEQKNLLGSDFGLDIIIRYKAADNNISTIEVPLKIDQMIGDPFAQRDQKQSVLIPTDKIIKEEDIQSICLKYTRKGVGFRKSIDENKTLFKESLIIIDYFLLEAVDLLALQQESADLTVYIATPKGRVFLPQGNGQINSTVELKAVLKENRVQIDSSNLQCYWYEKDPTWSSAKAMADLSNMNIRDDDQVKQDLIDYYYWKEEESGGNIAAFDYGGIGWRLVREDAMQVDLSTKTYSKVVENLSKNHIHGIEIGRENITPYKMKPSLSYFVKKEDLEGILSKQYKLVAFYNGIQLSTTIEILNSEENGAFTLDVMYDSKNTPPTKATYTVKSNFIINEDEVNYTYEWFYAADGSYSIPLTGRNTVELLFSNYKYSGQVICDIYKSLKNKKSRKLYCSLVQSYNTPLGDDVLFYGFEQTFLYNTQGEINFIGELENENKYTTIFREISISGKVSNIKWYVPKNSYFILPDGQSSEDALYRVYENRNSLNSLQIVKTLDQVKNRHLENIIVAYKYNNEDHIRSTNFSFLKEGEDGTNGSGVVLRVVPNVDDDEIMPNDVILHIQHGVSKSGNDNNLRALFNFYPKGVTNRKNYLSLTSNNNCFRAQLWKQNQKIFEGVQSSALRLEANVTALGWKLYNTDSFLSIHKNSALCVTTNTASFLTENEKDHTVIFANNKINIAQGIEATLRFGGMQLSYILPFIILKNDKPYGNGEDAATIRVPEIQNFSLSLYVKDNGTGKEILPKHNSIKLDNITKYYYNSDGEIEQNSGEDSKKKIYIDFQYYNKNKKSSSNISSFSQAWFEEYGSTKNISDFIDTFYDKSTGIPKRWQDSYEISIFTNEMKRGHYYHNKYNNDTFFRNCSSLNKKFFKQVLIIFPLMTFLNSQEKQLILDWGGTEAIVKEDEGEILSRRIIAGKKNTLNQFSGAEIGVLSQDEIGLKLYQDSRRSLYLSDNGTVEIGISPAERLQLNNDGQINFGLLKEGLTLDFKKPQILYSDNGSLKTSQDEDANIKEILVFKKGAENTFSVSDSGIVQAQEILGEKKNTERPIFKDDNRNEKDSFDGYSYFIKKNGVAGLKELYLHFDSTLQTQNSFLSTIINGAGITNGLRAFYSNKIDISGDLRSPTTSYSGFALTNEGLCIANAAAGGFSIITDGYIMTNEAFVIGSNMSKDLNSNWRLTKKGLYSPNSRQIIEEKNFQLNGGDGVSMRASATGSTKGVVITGASPKIGNALPENVSVGESPGILHIKAASGSRGITTTGKIVAQEDIYAGGDLSAGINAYIGDSAYVGGSLIVTDSENAIKLRSSNGDRSCTYGELKIYGLPDPGDTGVDYVEHTLEFQSGLLISCNSTKYYSG